MVIDAVTTLASLVRAGPRLLLSSMQVTPTASDHQDGPTAFH